MALDNAARRFSSMTEPVAGPLQLDRRPLGITGAELLGEGGDGRETELHGEHSLDKLASGRQKIVDGLLFGVVDERELRDSLPYLLRRSTTSTCSVRAICAPRPSPPSVSVPDRVRQHDPRDDLHPEVASTKATQ